MKKKSKVATIFPQFKLLDEKLFQTPIVFVFTNNGGEYIGLSPFLKTYGISHYTTITARNPGKLYDPSILESCQIRPLKLYVRFVSTLGLLSCMPHVLARLI